MTGFELIINGEKISAALEPGAVSIILTKVSNELTDSIDLDFTGLSLPETGDETEYIDWYRGNLKIGDELTIKVKEVLKSSTPKEVRKGKRESIIERKLKSYHGLKKELEDKGLI